MQKAQGRLFDAVRAAGLLDLNAGGTPEPGFHAEYGQLRGKAAEAYGRIETRGHFKASGSRFLKGGDGRARENMEGVWVKAGTAAFAPGCLICYTG